jgi:hypothetical protein
MTRHDDAGRRPASELDRLLGEWLTDGPRRAPEAPISVAIDFARSHPRRTDPLRAFRRDPMADRGGGLFALRPALALLTLGLLVAALVGVGVVGGVLRASPAPLPPPSGPAVPPPSSPAAPTASPTPSPSPSPRVIELALTTESATTEHVTFEDRSLRVTEIEDVSTTSLGEPGEGGLPGVTQIDDTTVDLLWVVAPCTGSHWGFVLDPTATALLFAPAEPCQGGDTPGFTRAIRVHFDGPVDAASIHVSSPTGSPGPS